MTHPSHHLNFGMNPDHARNSLSNCGIRQPKYGDRKVHHMHMRKKGMDYTTTTFSCFILNQLKKILLLFHWLLLFWDHFSKVFQWFCTETSETFLNDWILEISQQMSSWEKARVINDGFSLIFGKYCFLSLLFNMVSILEVISVKVLS